MLRSTRKTWRNKRLFYIIIITSPAKPFNLLTCSIMSWTRWWRNEAIEMHVCKLSVCLEKLQFDKIYGSVVKQWVRGLRASVEFWMPLGSRCALEKLLVEPQSAIASFALDPYASLVLNNRPDASITWQTNANHEPIVNLTDLTASKKWCKMLLFKS